MLHNTSPCLLWRSIHSRVGNFPVVWAAAKPKLVIPRHNPGGEGSPQGRAAHGTINLLQCRHQTTLCLPIYQLRFFSGKLLGQLLPSPTKQVRPKIYAIAEM